jgi:hypothetical protein
MHFFEHIIRHYSREAHQGFWSAVWGGLLILGSLLLSRFAAPASLAKGLSLPFVMIGLVFGIGGMLDGSNARRAIPGKVHLFNADRKAFFSEEVPQVERTHRSWRRGHADPLLFDRRCCRRGERRGGVGERGWLGGGGGIVFNGMLILLTGVYRGKFPIGLRWKINNSLRSCRKKPGARPGFPMAEVKSGVSGASPTGAF